MHRAISIIKSAEEYHLTHKLSFGTISICYRTVLRYFHLQKLCLGKDCDRAAAFGKSRAMRFWVGLWRFEKLKFGGLLEF